MTSAVIVAALFVPGCRRGADRDALAATTIIGTLSMVYGDAISAGQSVSRAFLTDSAGRTVQLTAGSSAPVPAEFRRFAGARVRVSGRYLDAGRTTFVVITIDSVGGAMPERGA